MDCLKENMYREILGEAELRTLKKKLGGFKLDNSEDQAWWRLRQRIKKISDLEREVEILKVLKEEIRGL